jgi:hypothetical protein
LIWFFSGAVNAATTKVLLPWVGYLPKLIVFYFQNEPIRLMHHRCGLHDCCAQTKDCSLCPLLPPFFCVLNNIHSTVALILRALDWKVLRSLPQNCVQKKQQHLGHRIAVRDPPTKKNKNNKLLCAIHQTNNKKEPEQKTTTHLPQRGRINGKLNDPR